MANFQIQVKSYAEGDHVEIRSRPERFSLGAVKKLHACKARPLKVKETVDHSVYVLKSLSNLDTSSTFNILNLVVFRTPAMISTEIFGPYPILERETLLECPLNYPERELRIERDLDGQAVMTRDQGYLYHLVRWLDQPDFEDSWVPREDPQHYGPTLLSAPD